MKFTLGIEQLDKMMKNMLDLSSLIVVAGHPGAGKTSFALKMCYENAKRGNRCVYFTFQEEKKKLYTVMSNLGINLEEVEKQGTFRFVRLPVILVSVEELLKIVNDILTKFEPKIIVVDSVNVLLKSLNEEEKRAYLQNYFYSLPPIINGVVVLVAELPFEQERLELGDIEFVADAIFILKHSIEHGLLVRTMEIRKARGAPIVEAEIPFSIVEGQGIHLHVSPIIEEIPRFEETIKPPCSLLEETIGEVPISSTIYVSYPADMRPAELFPLVAAYSVINDKKMLVISYRYSSKGFLELLERAFEQMGYGGSEHYRKVLEKIDFVGINPFALSISELYQREIELATNPEKNYDIIVFHGVELIESSLQPKYLRKLVNQLLYFKSKGKLVIRMASYIDERIYRINATISDLVFKFEVPRGGSYNDCKVMIWGMAKPLRYISCEGVLACVKESIWRMIQKVS